MTLILIPHKGGDLVTIKLPKDADCDTAALFAADLMDSHGVLEYEINTEIVAFSMVQDGTYDYNRRLTFVLENVADIKVALEGDVCLFLRPPEMLSR